jgi:hypothetical protein
LVATGTVSLTVSAVNDGPLLEVLGPDSIDELTMLVMTNIAIDPDLPSNFLAFVLVSGPTNALLDSATGVLTWAPEEDQGPGTQLFSVKVTDDGIPPLSTTVEFTVTVREVNQSPVLAAIADQMITEGQSLTLTNVAADSDIPANSLLFSLDGKAPSGMVLTSNGVLTWTPQLEQAPSTNQVTVIVTDDGSPSLSAVQSFKVTVAPQSLVIQSFHMSNSVVTIAWNAVVGGTYRLEYKNTLNETNWAALPPDVVATEPTAFAVDDSVNAPRRFYRVVRVP